MNAVLRKLAIDPPALPTRDRGPRHRRAHRDGRVGDRRAAQDPCRSRRDGARGRGLRRTRLPVAAGEPVRHHAGGVDGGAARRQASTLAPRTIHPDCLLLDGGDPTQLPGWREGWFAVQDQASAFVVAALQVREGDRVLDACAGPGGKAAHLACLVGASGTVVAADLHPQRAGLVRAGASRLGLHPLVLAQDATAPALRGAFDRILVDAPVLGDGVGAPSPGAPLASAQRRPQPPGPAPGGHHRRIRGPPGARRASRLLGLHLPAGGDGGRPATRSCATAPISARRRSKGPTAPRERVRLWPHRHGTDGMFVAAFVKPA